MNRLEPRDSTLSCYLNPGEFTIFHLTSEIQKQLTLEVIIDLIESIQPIELLFWCIRWSHLPTLWMASALGLLGQQVSKVSQSLKKRPWMPPRVWNPRKSPKIAYFGLLILWFDQVMSHFFPSGDQWLVRLDPRRLSHLGDATFDPRFCTLSSVPKLNFHCFRVIFVYFYFYF